MCDFFSCTPNAVEQTPNFPEKIKIPHNHFFRISNPAEQEAGIKMLPGELEGLNVDFDETFKFVL